MKGFTHIVPFISPSECKWNFTQPNGEFSSPYYPDNYHDYQDCQWNITAPRGHVIRLQFGVFELESNPHSCGDGRCSCDYVEVKEESVIGDVTVLGRYCMTITPPAIIESSTNKMVVRFYSDPAISAKGFNASYTTIASIKGKCLNGNRVYSRTLLYKHLLNTNIQLLRCDSFTGPS